MTDKSDEIFKITPFCLLAISLPNIFAHIKAPVKLISISLFQLFRGYFSKIEEPYKTFIRIVRGYESKHSNHIEVSKNKVVCTLFKQPLSNNSVLCGIFGENGEILDLFENN